VLRGGWRDEAELAHQRDVVSDGLVFDDLAVAYGEDVDMGLIFHSGGPIDEGWGVIDFWESREAFDRFIQERFQPALGQVADRTFQSPPEIKEFPVHTFNKP
jgi:hypothetical protein